MKKALSHSMQRDPFILHFCNYKFSPSPFTSLSMHFSLLPFLIFQSLSTSTNQHFSQIPFVSFYQMSSSSPNIIIEKANPAYASQSLTSNSYSCKKLTDEAKQVYVHHLIRGSTCPLSTKSLEMCTESLGSETGSSMIDSSIDEVSYHAAQKQSSGRTKLPKTQEFYKKTKHNISFPPPLTSISGSDGVQVQTHREGGRLVIKAFSFPFCSTHFQAERENGRLRFSLLKDGHWNSDPELVENEETEPEEENVDETKKHGDEDDLRGSYWGEREDGGKVGGGEWPSSRCNGDRSGSKRLPSLPFCVAIS